MLITTRLKNLRGSAFSSLPPDLLRPLMQIKSIAIFQLEYLRRNQSPTCHSRALKTTDDADDGENGSCTTGQEIRGCQKFCMQVWLHPRFQLVLFLSSRCDNVMCLVNLLFLLIASSYTRNKYTLYNYAHFCLVNQQGWSNSIIHFFYAAAVTQQNACYLA